MKQNERQPDRIFFGSRLVFQAAALLLVVGAANAQNEYQDSEYDGFGPHAKNFEFTLSGSGGSDNDFDRGAFGLAASLGYFLTDSIEMGARHNMTFFDAENSNASVAATTRIFADYHIDFDRFQPYLGVNLGIRYGDHVDEVGTVAPEWGLKFFALENTFIVASMEYQFFFDDVKDADNNADDGEFVYGLGLGFVF